jgi:hypothetical protein
MDNDDVTDRTRVHLDCEATALAFFYALDTNAPHEAAAQMMPDGVWHRGGTKLEGRDAIVAALQTRPASRRTCHVISNFRLLVVTDKHVTAAFYLVAYEGIQGSATGSPEAMRLLGIRDCRDSLTLTADGWRIAVKQSTGHLPMA